MVSISDRRIKNRSVIHQHYAEFSIDRSYADVYILTSRTTDDDSETSFAAINIERGTTRRGWHATVEAATSGLEKLEGEIVISIIQKGKL